MFWDADTVWQSKYEKSPVDWWEAVQILRHEVGKGVGAAVDSASYKLMKSSKEAC